MKRNEGESMDEYRARRKADKQATRSKLMGRWAWFSVGRINGGGYCKAKHGGLV